MGLIRQKCEWFVSVEEEQNLHNYKMRERHKNNIRFSEIIDREYPLNNTVLDNYHQRDKEYLYNFELSTGYYNLKKNELYTCNLKFCKYPLDEYDDFGIDYRHKIIHIDEKDRDDRIFRKECRAAHEASIRSSSTSDKLITAIDPFLD